MGVTRFWILLLLLLPTIAVPAAPETAVTRLRLTGGSATQRRELRKWARASTATARALAPRAPDSTLVLRLTGTGHYRHRDTWRYGVPEPDQWQARVAVTRAVLWHWLRPLAGAGAEPDAVPDWLVAGVYHRAAEHEAARHPHSRFPAMQALYEAGQLGSPEVLARDRLPPDEPELYRLYAQACGLLLKVLLTTDEAAVPRILADWDHRLPVAALREELRRHTGEEMLVAAWYRERVGEVLYRFDQPLSYLETRKRLRAMLRISLLVKDEAGVARMREVSLAELPEHLPALRRSRRGLDPMREKLLTLRLEAPLLLRPALDQYHGAVRLLQHGRIKRFREAATAAAETFSEAFARGQGIEGWLAKLAEQRDPHSGRLAPYYEDFTATPPDDYARAVRAWLDELAAPPERAPGTP